LIKNGLVLEHTKHAHSIQRKDVYVTDDVITAIIGDSQGQAVGDTTTTRESNTRESNTLESNMRDGPSVFNAKDFSPDIVVDATDKLIIPGLINMHTHAYMTLLRNCADDLTFDKWLFENILPREDKITREDAYWGSLLACMEMIKTGTTCFVDMHMFKGQPALAAKKVGMRAVISRGLVGDANDVGNSFRVDEALQEMDEYRDELLAYCLAPHAIYSCDTAFLTYISDLAYERRLMLNIHVSESKNEFDNCMEKHGKTPVEYLDGIDFFKAPTLAAHCVYLTENDIQILKKNNVNVITNPISNMKLSNGFAPILELMDAGVNVCIGTDGTASNNALNMFREMGVLSYIHKGLKKEATALDAFTTFKMATINAKVALGGHMNIGSLAAGRKADLSIINTNVPQLRPHGNLMSALIYSMNGSEVESVMVDGKFVLKDNKFVNVDEEEVYREVEKAARRIS